jgi:hypothetical protein
MAPSKVELDHEIASKIAQILAQAPAGVAGEVYVALIAAIRAQESQPASE